MRRVFFILPLVCLAALVFLFWRGLDPARDPASLPSALIGQKMADFSLDGLNGEPGLSSADFAGQVTVLNFFASWCAPCRAEHPLIQDLATMPGIRVVGITFKDTPQDSQKYLDELGNPYAAIGVDGDGRTGMEFGLTGVPETYVIDRDGIIRYRLAQPLDPARLDKELKPLLAELTK